jgi:hypothetical protein
MSGAASRAKGQRGERDAANIIAGLTGFDVKRRVRQRHGDSDLEGVPGWSIEIKNQARPNIPAWWRQTIEQAAQSESLPVLIYKEPRKGWKAMWPMSIVLNGVEEGTWLDDRYIVTSTIDAWCAVVTDIHQDAIDYSTAQRKAMKRYGLHER